MSKRVRHAKKTINPLSKQLIINELEPHWKSENLSLAKNVSAS